MRPEVGVEGSTSFYAFRDQFPDSGACLRHIAEVKFGSPLLCPRCADGHRLSSTGKQREIYCPRCRLYISPTAGTLMGHSRLPAWEWFYFLLLLANRSSGITVDHLARHMGISRLAAYRMLSLARLHICELRPIRQFGGQGEIVQIDETWLPNVRDSSQRNAKGAIVFGIHDKAGVQTCVIPNRRAATIMGLIEAWVAPGTTVITDSHRSYHALSKHGFSHVALNHCRGEWKKQGFSTAWIESYWNSLKYFMRSHNRVVKEAILPLYLAEHAFRHDARLAGACPFQRLIQAFPVIDQSRLPLGANPKPTARRNRQASAMTSG